MNISRRQYYQNIIRHHDAKCEPVCVSEYNACVFVFMLPLYLSVYVHAIV